MSTPPDGPARRCLTRRRIGESDPMARVSPGGATDQEGDLSCLLGLVAPSVNRRGASARIDEPAHANGTATVRRLRLLFLWGDAREASGGTVPSARRAHVQHPAGATILECLGAGASLARTRPIPDGPPARRPGRSTPGELFDTREDMGSTRHCLPGAPLYNMMRRRGPRRHASARRRPGEGSSRAPDCGRNSVVECQLPKLDVGGSNPLARYHKTFPDKDLRLASIRKTSSQRWYIPLFRAAHPRSRP